MGIKDEAENRVENAKGHVKETVGEATGDDVLADEGRAEQAEAEYKQTIERLRSSGKHAAEAVRETLDR
jgi:uncharacterized protein YjbJ (UPF0337 family)